MWNLLYLLNTATFLIALGALIKECFFHVKPVPKWFCPIIFILLVSSFIGSTVVIYREDVKNKYLLNSGVLSFRLEQRITEPIFSFGGARLVKKSGDFSLFNMLGEDLDVKLKSSIFNQQYLVNLTIRNNKNEELIRIENNRWRILNPDLVPQKNFNNNAFEALDREGNVIVRIRVLGESLDFAGKLYNSKGDGVAIVDADEQNLGGGGIIEIKKNGEKLESIITPIFKYPVEDFPGILLSDQL